MRSYPQTSTNQGHFLFGIFLNIQSRLFSLGLTAGRSRLARTPELKSDSNFTLRWKTDGGLPARQLI